ncbi:MAG TPA: RagB/SusD family nutrient uptake outer membrane protein, partial [Niastella sp.]|nr:RagB/SusD family nutrient uptake outer membrane protein [Niastella sp.]
SLPALPGSTPGDFIYQDTNADGKIDADDKTYYPFEVVVTSNETVQVASLIGYTLNHLGAAFASKAEVQTFLDDLYTSIGSWHQLQTVIDGVLSDDADCNISSTYCTLDNFSITSTTSFTTTLWQAGYSYISGLNRILTNLPALNVPAAEANFIIAQVKGLRAFVYYELATYYGGLPLLTKMVDDNKLSRSSLADTYQFIKNDLNAAVTVLPARLTGADHRRISADACRVLLARIAMAQGDFNVAKQLTNMLIQSAAYSLVSTGNIFVSDENAEIIWNISGRIAPAYNSFFNDGTGKTFCPVARYAEVLLINSEARVALGELDPANVNQLLGRRSQPAVTFVNNEQARDVVRLTWKNELHHEGQRFAKVVKWGTAAEAVGKGYKDYNSLMPVPQTVLNINSYVYQNPGY